LDSGLSEKLFKINANSQQIPWRFLVNYKYTIGKPLDSYESTYDYQPPFAPAQSFRISQAFNGSISHNDPYNQYAVDFSMPEGTAIHAAREGVVMAVESDFFRHGVDKKYLPEANSVRILHDDGSMAEYAHLELEKAVVFPGEKVGKGQLIGYSGNTGFSSGPHLHFSIQYNKGMELVSVPFSFTTSDGNRFLPEINKTLQGF
jgi:murein DD-endopeptidase MepM/ murein hydrolase activator NlpD